MEPPTPLAKRPNRHPCTMPILPLSTLFFPPKKGSLPVFHRRSTRELVLPPQPLSPPTEHPHRHCTGQGGFQGWHTLIVMPICQSTQCWHCVPCPPLRRKDNIPNKGGMPTRDYDPTTTSHDRFRTQSLLLAMPSSETQSPSSHPRAVTVPHTTPSKGAE